MVTENEVEDYFKKNYYNKKQQTNLNINKNLWIDYQKFCLELSKNSKLKITASARIRLLLVKDMLDNKL